MALQDKATAQQEKAALDRQLKQQQGQKLMMEKTLEKKDAIEYKKRESIMVVSRRLKGMIAHVLVSVPFALHWCPVYKWYVICCLRPCVPHVPTADCNATRPQNLSKSKEQLNSFEERLKQTSVELQKVQMDLMAKQSEYRWWGWS